VIGRPIREDVPTPRGMGTSSEKSGSYVIPGQECATCGQSSRASYHWTCRRDETGRLLVKEER
jgi:hypothetical protein